MQWFSSTKRWPAVPSRTRSTRLWSDRATESLHCGAVDADTTGTALRTGSRSAIRPRRPLPYASPTLPGPCSGLGGPDAMAQRPQPSGPSGGECPGLARPRRHPGCWQGWRPPERGAGQPRPSAHPGVSGGFPARFHGRTSRTHRHSGGNPKPRKNTSTFGFERAGTRLELECGEPGIGFWDAVRSASHSMTNPRSRSFDTNQ
jgi:hypothetical protein